jgi:RES domain-containing protein
MELFRLSGKRWSSELTGKGAALKGARWNSQGTEIIYTASNRSLAMAEVLVHFTLATIPGDYMMVTIFVPDDIAYKIIWESDLPAGWNSFPPIPSTQNIGDNFIKQNEFCLLKIPSVVTKGDFNFLVNPFHPEFARIKIVNIEPFYFDHRIFR